MSDKAEKKINESELTDLVLKLNQEQLNLKKKVERRDAEITRMKQTMAEKEEEWQKRLKAAQQSAQDQSSSDHSTDRPRWLEQLIALLSTTEETPITEQQVVAAVEKLLEQVNSLKTAAEITRKDSKLSSEKTAPLKNQSFVGSESNLSTSKRILSEEEQQNEIAKLQDQLRMDTNYYNKKLNQMEQNLFNTKKQYEEVAQKEHEGKLIAEAKVSFLQIKIDLYEQAIQEIHLKTEENHAIKSQVLEQYVQVSEKYKDLIKQVKNLGNSTGQGENSKMEIQKLEAQKQFLIQQIAQFEKSISQIETQVTNLEKVTIKK